MTPDVNLIDLPQALFPSYLREFVWRSQCQHDFFAELLLIPEFYEV